MTGVPPTVMSEGGIIRNGHTVHLQLGRPSEGWTAHLSHMKLLSLSIELDLLLRWSYDCLGCLLPLEGPISPSSRASSCLFLLRSRLGFSPRSVGSWGEGRGGFIGGLDLFMSWGEGALFLPFISSLKLGPVLGAISSSSSEESPT